MRRNDEAMRMRWIGIGDQGGVALMNLLIGQALIKIPKIFIMPGLKKDTYLCKMIILVKNQISLGDGPYLPPPLRSRFKTGDRSRRRNVNESRPRNGATGNGTRHRCSRPFTRQMKANK